MRVSTKAWNSLVLTIRLTVLSALSMLIAPVTGGIVTIVSPNTHLTNQQDAQLSTAARVPGPNATNPEDYSQLHEMLPNDYYVYVHFTKSFNKPDREFVTGTTKREVGVPTFSPLPIEKDIPATATSSFLIMSGTTVPPTREGQNWRILSIMLT